MIIVELYPIIHVKSISGESFLLIAGAQPGHESHHVRVMGAAAQIAPNKEKWSQLSPDTQRGTRGLRDYNNLLCIIVASWSASSDLPGH